MSVAVKVKWNKQVFDVDVDTASMDGLALKEKLCELTSVPVDRQKVMAKGLWKGTLKDEQALAGLAWKAGAVIAMMGTAGQASVAPKEKTVFVEDMSAMEKQAVAAEDPPGLSNLGNTCYLNSTLQCLRAIPELKGSLQASSLNAQSGDVSEKMTVALRDLFSEMDGSTGEVQPYSFVSTMRLTFPQFAEQTPRGGFAQQDSDEFFNELITVLAGKLTTPGPGFSFGSQRDAVNALFGVDFTTKMSCIESEAEDVVRGEERALRLQCNITADVMTLEQGLKLGLEAELEKHSAALGANALWKQTRRIHQLPKYLVIQLNRFFWKRTPNSRDHEGVSCKILKPVKFAFSLDVYDFCDEDLQQTLKGPRNAHAKERMVKAQKKAAGGDKVDDDDDDDDGDAMKDVEDSDPELAAALRMSMAEGGAGAGAGSPGIGFPPNFRGTFELFGVVTHKGRASNSGHYLGWVKQGKGATEAEQATAAAAAAAAGGKRSKAAPASPAWMCFDDETASQCTEEDVGKLSGGGDYDMGYMLFYRAFE